MKVNFKINIDTQIPDSEVDEILKTTSKKINDYRKLLEYEMEKSLRSIFMQEELISCKVKVSFKKDGDSTDS